MPFHRRLSAQSHLRLAIAGPKLRATVVPPLRCPLAHANRRSSFAVAPRISPNSLPRSLDPASPEFRRDHSKVRPLRRRDFSPLVQYSPR